VKRISIIVILSAIVLLSFGTGYWCALSDIDEPEKQTISVEVGANPKLYIDDDYNFTKICPIVFYNNSIEFINHNETHHRFDIVKNNTVILSVFVDKNTSMDLQDFFTSMIYVIIDMDYKLSSITGESKWRV